MAMEQIWWEETATEGTPPSQTESWHCVWWLHSRQHLLELIQGLNSSEHNWCARPDLAHMGRMAEKDFWLWCWLDVRLADCCYGLLQHVNWMSAQKLGEMRSLILEVRARGENQASLAGPLRCVHYMRYRTMSRLHDKINIHDSSNYAYQYVFQTDICRRMMYLHAPTFQSQSFNERPTRGELNETKSVAYQQRPVHYNKQKLKLKKIGNILSRRWKLSILWSSWMWTSFFPLACSTTGAKGLPFCVSVMQNNH